MSKKIVIIGFLVTLLIIFSSSSNQRYPFGSSISPFVASNAQSQGIVISTINKGGNTAIETRVLSSVQTGNLLVLGITIEGASINSVTDNQSNIWTQLVSKPMNGSDGNSYYAYVYSATATKTGADKITVTTNSGLKFVSWFAWNTLGYTGSNFVTASSSYDGNGVKSNCNLSMTPNSKTSFGFLNIGICSTNTVGPANGVTSGYSQLTGQSTHEGFGLYRANATSSTVSLQVKWTTAYQPTEYVFVGVSFMPNSVSQVPPAVTPIQHIVIIMQENHAFDSMFGTFPGLPAGYAENLNTCMPVNPPALTPCIKPWNADSKQSTIQGTDIPHTRAAALTTYNGGAMNGFVKAMPSTVKNYTMAYYNGTLLPYYWNYASYYTMNYNFFSSAMSYSLPNHLFAVAGQAGQYASTCLSVCNTEYNLTFPQIGETLTQAGIPWGYYQYNWNDSINCPVTPYTRDFVNSHNKGFDGLWSGLTDFTQVQANSIECRSLGNLKDLQTAVTTNNLPSVSWVNPEPQVSDHPGQGAWSAGQQYVASLINMIETSPEWSSTVIYLTWDDYGGYYDGVSPPQFDTAGEGYRVPLIAISPYSIPGGMIEAPAYNYNLQFTNVHAEDFSAFLSTIEYNWNLSPLTVQDTHARDGNEINLFYMLNFNQTPVKPLILGTSGVSYPISSCASTSCSFNAAILPQNLAVYNPNVGINESVSQALTYSGNDDPGD